MKKVLATMLALVMVFALVPAVFAEECTNIDHEQASFCFQPMRSCRRKCREK